MSAENTFEAIKKSPVDSPKEKKVAKSTFFARAAVIDDDDDEEASDSINTPSLPSKLVLPTAGNESLQSIFLKQNLIEK